MIYISAIKAGTRKTDFFREQKTKQKKRQLENDAQEASRQAALRSGTRHRCINMAAQTFTFSNWAEPSYCPLLRTIWPPAPPPPPLSLWHIGVRDQISYPRSQGTLSCSMQPQCSAVQCSAHRDGCTVLIVRLSTLSCLPQQKSY